jgi:uncharacterized protein (TIGR03083 family)
MENEALLKALHDEGLALAAAAATATDTPVPTCPAWTVGQLVGHVGGVHRWATEIVSTGDRPAVFEESYDGDDLFGWYRDGLASLEARLEGADPDQEVWTFGASRDRRVSWWIRRQALETAVHRWDAAAAATPEGGPVPGFSAELAAAGIDEYLADFLPRAFRKPVPGVSGTLHVHCHDTQGEWFIDLSAESPAPQRIHAKADTAVRGHASDLYLWLWNRQSAAPLEVLGDHALVEKWRQLRF